MMQLLCNGTYLDLGGGQKVTFQKSNPLFAFDSLKCERTTEFSLLDTPTNNRVLSLAKDPAFYGDGMRRKFDAQLINGVCVKNGYLYVSKFDKTYRAVFVTGELLGLRKIKELGKLAEICQFSSVVQYGSTSSDKSGDWGCVPYIQDGERIHPSSRIVSIVSNAVSRNHLPPISLPASVNMTRIVKGEMNGIGSMATAYHRAWAADYVNPTQQTPPIVNANTIDEIPYMFGTATVDSAYSNFLNGIIQWTLSGKIAHLVARQNITITFPDDFPTNVYVGRFVNGGLFEDAFEFIGDYSFTKVRRNGLETVIRIGSPLGSRSVDIGTGEKFVFVKESDFLVYESTTSSGTQGWKVNTSIDAVITIEGRDIEVGDLVRLQDNLPDITMTELLKTVAAISRTAINYTDADGITFDAVNVNEWQVIDLTNKLSKIGDVSRTFADYARINTVQFKTDETVPMAQRLNAEYFVDNDNLADNKVLQEIPFSEGGVDAEGSSQVLFLKAGNKTDTMADANTPTVNMVRVSLGTNAGISKLCGESTKVMATLYLTQYEFDQITAKVRLLLNGQLYVWTEATWNDGVAKLTLSKV